MISANIRENKLTDRSSTFDVLLKQNEGNPFHESVLELNCLDAAHAERVIDVLRTVNNVLIKVSE